MKPLTFAAILFCLSASNSIAQTQSKPVDQATIDAAMAKLQAHQNGPIGQLERDNAQLKKQLAASRAENQKLQQRILDLENDLPNPELVKAINALLTNAIPTLANSDETSVKLAANNMNDILQSIHSETKDAIELKRLIGGLKVDCDQWVSCQDQIEQYETLNSQHTASVFRMQQSQMVKLMQNTLVQLTNVSKKILDKNRTTPTTQPS